MEQAEQNRLIDKALEREQRKETEVGNSETQWPVQDYFDPDRYQRERQMIRRQPLIVAHASEIAQPGDYVVKDLMGTPIIVVRDELGKAKVHINVCRHRGAALLPEGEGSGLFRFRCPYHGWCYQLDGLLANVPDQARSFPNLDKAERPLTSLPCAEHHGFIWTIPDPVNEIGSVPDIPAFLGPSLDREFAAYEFDKYTFYRRESWEGAFNWKSGVEQFLENYHFAVLHRDSTNWLFIHNLALCDRFEHHFRGVAPKRSIRDLANQPREQWSLRPNATIIYTIFPVATFFVEKSHFSLLQIFPTGPERSRVEITHVVSQDQLSKRPFWEANIDLFKAAVKEDLETCETMQVGFRSRANDYLMFGRNEIGLDQYRRCIEVALDTEIQQE